jgi:hypothetical protein
VGGPSLLSECLTKRVAFHHAGISHETRWLLERLICDREVDVVCGTTTLAQGVNFPISSVIVETLRKGKDSKLSHSEFWNIAGRAGRALMDTVGLVGFPSPSQDHRDKFQEFLRGEAEEIVSQLMDILDVADKLTDSLNLNSLRHQKNLSSFLRFLSHAALVAGKSNVADDVEDILRASLLYNQAQKQGKNRTASLVKLCRKYFSDLKSDSTGVLSLADRTGFATPSVKFLLATISNDHKDFKRPETWHPDQLFGDDISGLTDRIKVISDVPEMSLGQGDARPFNPELVAAILRDWVRGTSLQQMADNYWQQESESAEDRLTNFSNYLFSTVINQASWGLGALQGCSLKREEIDPDSPTGFVPSMAFFGVQNKEAVWLRMAGAPRIIAEHLGGIWKEKETTTPTSYQQLRDWVGARSNHELRGSLPPGSNLTVEAIRQLWEVFSGEPSRNQA